MTSDFFPSLADMQQLSEWFATFVAYGMGLQIVFWTLGYCVWFIVQFFR